MHNMFLVSYECKGALPGCSACKILVHRHQGTVQWHALINQRAREQWGVVPM